MFVAIFSLLLFRLFHFLRRCIWCYFLSVWYFSVRVIFFLIDFNRGRFLQLLILFYLIHLCIKSNRPLIFFEQQAKIYLLKIFSLPLESIVNIDFILLIIVDEETLPKVCLLGITTKWIELISADREVIDYWVVMKLELIIIFLEFLNKTIN